MRATTNLLAQLAHLFLSLSNMGNLDPYLILPNLPNVLMLPTIKDG